MIERGWTKISQLEKSIKTMKLSSIKARCPTILILIVCFVIYGCNEEIVYPEGGYSYLKDSSPKDSNFYFLPIRKSVDRRDSINILLGKMTYDIFDEPNLSIAPPVEDVFRFNYSNAFGDLLMIVVNRDKIIIKTPIDSLNNNPGPLTWHPVEKLHFNLFDSQFDLNSISVKERKHIDSLLKLYPTLFDFATYLKIVHKMFPMSHFKYTKKEIKISKAKYRYFVDLINKSEFWQRPFHIKEHEGEFADGYTFILEGATKNKYQCIMSNMHYDGPSKYRRVFDEIVKYTSSDSLIAWQAYNDPSKKWN